MARPKQKRSVGEFELGDWERWAEKLPAKSRKDRAGFIIRRVSGSEYFMAKSYGGCVLNGRHYRYIPEHDLLVRLDFLVRVEKAIAQPAKRKGRE